MADPTALADGELLTKEARVDNVLVLIPAPLHGPGVPRLLLRNLGTDPLLKHAVATARGVVQDPSQIVVITDDEEVALLGERLGCRTHVRKDLDTRRLTPAQIFDVVSAAEAERPSEYESVLLLRPFSPLLRSETIAAAIDQLFDGSHDSVLSAREEVIRGWRKENGRYHPDFGDSALDIFESEAEVREAGAFLLSRRSAVSPEHFAADNVGLALLPAREAIEIVSWHEWWICERLLKRKRVVFVVIGYPEVGLGHVYRATFLAADLTDHEIVFLCTTESELAAERLRSQEFPVHVQAPGQDLVEAVLELRPDLVINDVLNTPEEYVRRLKDAGAAVVNFEDLGAGAAVADLVVNAIYSEESAPPNHRNGPNYFWLRDEFQQVDPKDLLETPEEVLITFGGTDANDLTSRVARLVVPIALERGLRVSIVTGYGYRHVERLSGLVDQWPNVELANGTKRMSDYMARADLAFSSAGRTVFELAAMRVPAVIIASNEREETHTFAAAENGFSYLGRHDKVRDADIVRAFLELLDSTEERRERRKRMQRWDFRGGAARVRAAIMSVIESGVRR